MARSRAGLVGNLLCLDLVNTERLRGGERVDLLGDFDGLARWLVEAGALSAAAADRSVRAWGGRRGGAQAFAEATRLRAALRRAAERMARGEPPGDAVVRAINRILASRPAYSRLVRQDGKYATRLEPVSESPLQLLVPVAESAAWLLEHGNPALVRHCAGPDCVLVFYDTTKNRSRRWCSMDGCGSRAKAGAYYRRRHPPA
jgi:predicted RNA-binding Zn ribbon-like protein